MARERSKSAERTRIDESDVLETSVGQLRFRDLILPTTSSALVHDALTESRSSLTVVLACGKQRQYSRIFWRKKSFSVVRGIGFSSRFPATYQRSILEFKGCNGAASEPLGLKDEASKTSSMSRR